MNVLSPFLSPTWNGQLHSHLGLLNRDVIRLFQLTDHIQCLEETIDAEPSKHRERYLLFCIAIGIDAVVDISHGLLDDRYGVRTFRLRIDTFARHQRGNLLEGVFQMLSSFLVRHLQFTFLQDLEKASSIVSATGNEQILPRDKSSFDLPY